MYQGIEISVAVDYAGTGEKQARKANQDGRRTGGADQTELDVLVELVVIDGPEGQKLHAMQAEVIHRILARLAGRQIQTSEKESGL